MCGFFEDFRPALGFKLNDGGKLLPLGDEKLLPKEAAKREETNISTYHFWPAACDFPILREQFWRNYADQNSHDCLVLSRASVRSFSGVFRGIAGFGISRDDS